MTEEFKKYVLKNVPTKVLLREFKRSRHPYTSRYGNREIEYFDDLVQIDVGPFAFWNPYKGHKCTCEYTTDEVKAELDTREHVER